MISKSHQFLRLEIAGNLKKNREVKSENKN